ncbi:MAG: C4-type zinc ribbon domain-containing protein [Planctomycetota bacterium]
MATQTPIEFSSGVLRRLHRIHSQVADLGGQLRRGPLQVKALQAKVDASQLEVDQAAELLKKTRLMADEKQLQLQSREAQMETLKAKLNTAASNKEFQLLKDQIAADEQANSVQSDEIFEVLERIDSLEIALAEKKESHGEVEADFAKRHVEIEKRMTQVQEELERSQVQLTETEADVPAAVRSDYRRLVDARGEEAFAPIENDSCGGCHQTLTTQVANQVMLAQLVFCPNCNAFLYSPEDRRVR